MKKIYLYFSLMCLFVLLAGVTVFVKIAASKDLGVLSPKVEFFVDSNPFFLLFVFLFTFPGWWFWIKIQKEYYRVYGVNLLK